MRALSIAATGMAAQATQLEVVANNIANTNTTGFKRARAEFTDLMYQVDRMRGVASRGGENNVPEGSSIGLGVRTAAVRQVNLQGAVQQTGNRLDIAITGDGWLGVTDANGETLYTRAGALNTNANGDIVNVDGLVLSDGIVVPDQAQDLTITESGTVFARIAGEANPQEIGQLTLSTFINPNGLEPIGGNLFRLTDASGPAVSGIPGETNLGTLRQGFLEQSNVDSIKEITDMIAAQRAYEMNSKVIQAADEMAGIVSKGIR